jgi:hypothetical protein
MTTVVAKVATRAPPILRVQTMAMKEKTAELPTKDRRHQGKKAPILILMKDTR